VLEVLDMKMQTVKITNLLLSVENPRFEKVESQREAIDIMVGEQRDKLINLAKDIVEAGINPGELTFVTPEKDNMFKVLEGNRRVAALKLLNSPELLKDKHKSFTKKVKAISGEFQKKPIKEILCVVFSNPSDANRWIKLRHTGENKGRGTVPWDYQQMLRFDAQMEKKSSIGLQAIDFLKNCGDKTLISKLPKVSITNLERLLSDKNIQEVIGIRVKDGMLETDLLKEETHKGLIKIVQDIIDKKIRVKDIYTKDDRKRYIEKHFTDQFIPDKSKLAENTWQLGVFGQQGQVKKVKRRAILPSTSREKIIPRDCVLSIKEPKNNAIYLELKDLNIDTFVNAGAVLLRVFIELSVDAFSEKYKLSLKDKKNNPLKFNQKVQQVVNYMENSGIANKSELKGIQVAVSNKYSVLSIDTFHSYAHNRHFSPIANDIKTTWDNIQIFMKKLWENVS